MSHPLVVALFSTSADAAGAARALHALGVPRDRLSVVSRSHDEEGALATQMDATPGADLEDSRPAARLGELSGQVLAAIALVMPGIGPIVTAGPLSAELGEAAGHAAGGVAAALGAGGIPEEAAKALEREIAAGAVLLGVHAMDDQVGAVRRIFGEHGARYVEIGTWDERP